MKEFEILIAPTINKSIDSTYGLGDNIITEGETPWDAAHRYRQKTGYKGFTEPNIINNLYNNVENSLIAKSIEEPYLQNWPSPPEIENHVIWHLLDDFSQLRKAKERVWKKVQKDRCIKIAHIDTGYQPNHPALPKFMTKGISFLKDENEGSAIDVTKDSFQEQDGHGTATMSILAGNKVSINSNGITFNDELGAIPFAEIIPIRICDTVALIRSQNFVKALDYAIDIGCEVVTMSMAGVPTNQWANAINRAYEAGVTVVTAAGNSWNKEAKRLLPKKTLYPARWKRVISATGVTANHLPYVFKAQISAKTEGGETMQGNFGPKKVMDNSIAAYTPNTVWATMNQSNDNIFYRLDGGGTSSATPQIAAAAALWLSFHRDKIESNLDPAKKWKKVEAVKYALFNSADKSYEKHKKYYGQGILKANDALNIFPDWKILRKSKKAKCSLNGILDLLGIMLRLKGNQNESEEEMYATEILQLLHTEPDLHNYLKIDEDEKWSQKRKREIIHKLMNSEKASSSLKRRLNSIVEDSGNLNLSNAHALLIGVGGHDIPVTVDDAKDLGELLKDSQKAAYRKENVKILVNEDANRFNVLASLENIVEKVKSEDDATVIVYYSGHGGIVNNGSSNEYYLLTHGANSLNRENTMVSGSEFSDLINRINAKKLLVMLDCCHASGMIEDKPLLKLKSPDLDMVNSNVELLKRLNTGGGKVFITSCDDDEQSVILPGAKNSLFTAVVLEALAGYASDGDPYVRMVDLLYHVLREVPRRVKEYKHVQRPIVNRVKNLSSDYFLCRSSEVTKTFSGINKELLTELLKTYNLNNSHKEIDINQVSQSSNEDKSGEEIKNEISAIRKEVSKNQIGKSISLLLKLAKSHFDSYFNGIIMLSGDYNDLLSKKQKGIIDDSSYRIWLAQIKDRILTYLDMFENENDNESFDDF
ncbi:S8 family serine peptidase [Flavivirga aquimarina]|uniref:S8 family serine peptidase n=1 Tax=Flavivirga aquimarina TaxID=2027862 RepID=A0ABT8WD20_9FLAO|nr:S8 family serine peptidase [Flavivirga aquimarina]MDO5971044.1 S8 family serine peptidase [Flavivirga aquimarina]